LKEDEAMSLGAYDLNGPQFLFLYVLLLFAALAFSYHQQRRHRPEGSEQVSDDASMLAYLAGGADRVCDSAIMRLVMKGGIEYRSNGTFVLGSRDVAADPTEKVIVNTTMPTVKARFLARMERQIGQLEQRMTKVGLLTNDQQAKNLRLAQSLPLLLLFGFGFVKLIVGISREKPVGFLILLLLVTAVIGFVRYTRIDRKTSAGIRALEESRAQNLRLNLAPTTPEMGLAVALFGMPVLLGSPFESLYRRSNGADGGGSSGGSGCGSDSGGGGGSGNGSSGCGGGGCGGCGS
jgi:uncharacterized protein (TIGR04222 family)